MQQHLLQGCLSFFLDLLSTLLCCRAKSLQVPVEAKVQSLPARLRTDTKPHSLQQLLSDEKHSGQKHSSETHSGKISLYSMYHDQCMDSEGTCCAYMYWN